MTGYLLDTNACDALINGSPPEVRRRFERVIAGNAVVLLSSIASFELWYGVGKSQRTALEAARLETFLAGPLEWVVFEEQDAREAGAIRSELEQAGRPIGAYDVLLAGQARRLGATLVTSNVREFERVTGLRWEDWAAPRARKRP